MKAQHVIDIARDFSRFPGGRSRSDGPNSGEEFLERFLKPSVVAAIRNGDLVTISLDGVAGLPASFLDAAFGGLVRSHVASKPDIMKVLRIQADTARVKIYPPIIQSYIEAAQ